MDPNAAEQETRRRAQSVRDNTIVPALAKEDGRVKAVAGTATDPTDPWLEELFGGTMRIAMAKGGRRLALRWLERLEITGTPKTAEAARECMRAIVNYSVVFGALAPPLASQIGCREELLEREQKHADAIVRLTIEGICTNGESERMRRRLVKRINRKVLEDEASQTPPRG